MKLVLIDNIAAHYRGPIFRLLDSEIGLDFFVGDKQEDVKKMDYTTLRGRVSEVHNRYFRHCYYQVGVPSLLFKSYDTYLILGDMRCLSTWMLLIGHTFFPRKRMYLWSHGDLGKSGKLHSLIMRLFYSMANGAFIYNERSREIMIRKGVPAHKLRTIYNSLDYDRQLPIRQELHTDSIYSDHFKNDNRNIIFIGRLTKVKRLDLILEALSVLRERGEYYNVTFIGDGVERQLLEAKVRELNLSGSVWFYGECYEEKENACLIYNADLCVSPGNIGLTAMHVLMFGCPAITNDDFNHQMPEFEAIIDGKTGSFFNDGDSLSLADSISGWFDTHQNDREIIRNNCYQVIDGKWNPHNQIAIFKDVLLNIE